MTRPIDVPRPPAPTPAEPFPAPWPTGPTTTAATVVYVCAWCSTALAVGHIDADGLWVCSAECAHWLWVCSDCGCDVRVCGHRAGWVS